MIIIINEDSDQTNNIAPGVIGGSVVGSILAPGDRKVKDLLTDYQNFKEDRLKRMAEKAKNLENEFNAKWGESKNKPEAQAEKTALIDKFGPKMKNAGKNFENLKLNVAKWKGMNLGPKSTLAGGVLGGILGGGLNSLFNKTTQSAI